VKTKINKFYTLFIVSVLVFSLALILLIINEFSSYPMFFMLGFSFSLLIISIYLLFEEKKSANEFEDYLKKIDSLLNHDLNLSDLQNPTHNLFVNRLNTLVENVIEDVRRQKKFSGDVAHELKTPLTILRGELELALRNKLSPHEYQGIISSSLDEVLRLIKILQSVLEITKANSGKIILNFENHNFSKLLNELIDDVKILSAKKNIDISFEIDSDIEFEFDDLRMQQALLNLIENAVKYTDNFGSINIVAFQNSNDVTVRIKDNGIGIPKDKQKFIFDRFFQIKDSPDTKNGAGIGLSIVKWIIDKHNGIITVNSELGKGTEFVIILPKVQNDKN
jgi:signal transduction histidine kinase